MKIIILILTITCCLLVTTSNASVQLWGMTNGGGINNQGAIIKMNEDGSNFQMIFSFGSTSGVLPYGSLLFANNQKLYGITHNGGLNDKGTIFSIDPASNNFSVLYNFDSINGSFSESSLIQCNNSLLYGTTLKGGIYDGGVIFSFDISTNTLTILHNFDGLNGANPFGRLLQANNGIFYGMAAGGLHSDGVVFSFDPSTNIYSDLHDFNVSDGHGPVGDLIQANNGLLYGITYIGGLYNNGVIFSYDISIDSLIVLHNFNPSNHRSRGTMLNVNNGLLLGLANNYLFSFNLSGNIYSDLFTLTNTTGFGCRGSIIKGSTGLLYGYGSNGGANNFGTIFSFDTATNALINMHDFAGAPADGHQPYGDLTEVIIESVGVPSISNTNMINIYPNPTNTSITIHQSNYSTQSTILTVTDIFGRVIYKKTLTSTDTKIDVSKWSAGFYFYEVRAAQETYRGKILKE